jgi:hypothetical protein
MEKTTTKINLCPCESSRIAAHGHDPETNTLALQFKNKNGAGPVYHYAGFTASDYAAFTGAESLGRHFGTVISAKNEDGSFRFPYTKIEEAKAEERSA